MTRSQAVAVVIGLIVIFAVAGAAGIGDAGGSPLEETTARAPQASEIGWGTLLSGLVGALAVALITVGHAEVREKRERVRARMGYARLLDAEIEANEPVVNELGKHRDRFLMSLPKDSYPAPRIEAWPEIRVKLAPLIEADDFASIHDYYRQLRRLRDLKEGKAVAAERGEPVNTFVGRLREHTQEARQRLSKYANPPPSRVRLLGAAVRLASREAPRRSWWRRLFEG